MSLKWPKSEQALENGIDNDFFQAQLTTLNNRVQLLEQEKRALERQQQKQQKQHQQQLHDETDVNLSPLDDKFSYGNSNTGNSSVNNKGGSVSGSGLKDPGSGIVLKCLSGQFLKCFRYFFEMFFRTIFEMFILLITFTVR